MNLRDHLGKRIVVCCGSGGVGKTTIAAALALQGAIQGQQTLVITIDPAKISHLIRSIRTNQRLMPYPNREANKLWHRSKRFSLGPYAGCPGDSG